ncbi:hypothetical protein CVT25_013539 [Psilocybe cyanescens]|uniref:Uncharacterized protein n=1 Tax=Psilocybe cyanescens TaxID=93625 RepID=A0A409XSZ2_PSICY|nr:hypothetical protein CVT25_013539 [Psilocybe cyanescens]
MALPSTPAPNLGPPATPAVAHTPLQQPISGPQPPRPLQREGAIFILSSAEQAIEDAMMRSSPPPERTVLGKRPHQVKDSLDGNDTEHDDEPSSTAVSQSLPSISNVAAAVSRYVSRKKLRPEQRDEVDAFLLDTALGRQAKLFTCILSLENKVDAFRSAAPPYQLSEDLKTNINNYGIAVLLSANISAYKGDVPRNHVLTILKKLRFDLPAGVEHDYASWEKISAYVSYSLTQTRARMKKLIKESLKANTNIFSLAQMIVHPSSCRTTIQLCARVALMRAIHAECSGGEKYWNLIDTRLEFIRTKAGSSPAKTARAFNKILKVDRATYATEEDYEIVDVVAHEVQQRVDDVVAGALDISQNDN